RAKASGSPQAVAAARVNAWITGLTSTGVAQSSFNQPLLGAGSCTSTPDGEGYVYCSYTAPSTLPSGGIAPVFARARVSAEAGATATSRGPVDPAAAAWAPAGEIEDYQMGVAGSVLRIQARTLGDVPANVSLKLTNVSSTAPSTTTAQVTTNAASSFSAASSGHALVSRNAATTLTTAGVGAVGATELGGWRLADRTASGNSIDTWCQDTQTGADLKAAVDAAAGTVTIPVAGASLPQDITCHLTYAPQADLTTSTVTATPSNNQANPQTSPNGYSTVALALSGKVLDLNGQEQVKAPAGSEVALALSAILGSGASKTGAEFRVSADGGETWQAAGQSYTCAVDAAGACATAVRIAGLEPGGYNLTAKVGGSHINNAATGQPTDASPVTVYFKAGSAAPAYSSMTITTTANQVANHGAPGTSKTDWGKQTITVTLKDSANLPYQDGAAAGGLTASAPADGGPEGVYYSAATGQEGQFSCAAALVADRCAAGVYKLDVYASTAGPKQITVTHRPAVGAPFDVTEQGTGRGYVTAVFTAPPAAQAASLIVFSAPGESVPANDWNDPAVEPDGEGVTHTTGYTFHPAIRVWDAGRDNPVNGAQVRFRVDAACPAVFIDNGQKTYQATTSAEGKATAELRSQVAATCLVHGDLYQGGQWLELPGGDGNPWVKQAKWEDGTVDLAASSFTVSSQEVVADGKSSGTVSVSLMGLNGLPVTSAATALAGFGPTGGGVSVGGFEHLGGGVYEAAFSGLKAGLKRLTVQVDGQNLEVAVDGNRIANLIAGPPAAAQSWLVQPDQTAPADGASTIPLLVRVFDAAGNPANSGQVEFALSAGLTANGLGATAQAAVAGGLARLGLASTKAATHQVTATIAGEPVAKVMNAAESALVAGDGVAHLTFSAGTPSPAASSLSIPTAGADGATTLPAGGAAKHRAVALVADANGNPVLGGAATVVFSYSYTDQAGKLQQDSTAPIATDADGLASWEFGSTAAAIWTVTGRIVGTTLDVAGSPKTAGFHPGAFSEAATLASFAVDSAVKKADGIAYAEARMKAQDQYGNALSGLALGFVLDYSAAQGALFASAANGAKTSEGSSGADGWVRANVYS
ncbi:MAG: Ig-like domain-containing protein, partial [Bifidobacteriaceae bacterium]|nr:Ig-like domain-containing protein [Bifidobacteriaceae bacterium]